MHLNIKAILVGWQSESNCGKNILWHSCTHIMSNKNKHHTNVKSDFGKIWENKGFFIYTIMFKFKYKPILFWERQNKYVFGYKSFPYIHPH